MSSEELKAEMTRILEEKAAAEENLQKTEGQIDELRASCKETLKQFVLTALQERESSWCSHCKKIFPAQELAMVITKNGGLYEHYPFIRSSYKLEFLCSEHKIERFRLHGWFSQDISNVMDFIFTQMFEAKRAPNGTPENFQILKFGNWEHISVEKLPAQITGILDNRDLIKSLSAQLGFDIPNNV